MFEIPDYYAEAMQLVVSGDPNVREVIRGRMQELRKLSKDVEDQGQLLSQLFRYLESRERESEWRLVAVYPAGEKVPRAKRGERIDAAISLLINEGERVIVPSKVLERLLEQGFDLDVQQPLSVIGTVMARSPLLTKQDRNMFMVKETEG